MNIDPYVFEIGVDKENGNLVRVSGMVEETGLEKAVHKILGDHGSLLSSDGAYCEIAVPNTEVTVTIITEYIGPIDG